MFKFLSPLAAVCALAMFGVAQATTVDVEFLQGPTVIAEGTFSYSTGTVGTIGFGDLDNFDIQVAGFDYNFGNMGLDTDYLQFSYDTVGNDLQVGMPDGFAGPCCASILSAVNDDGTSGFFFQPAPGTVAVYDGVNPDGTSPLTLSYDSVVLTPISVPEPATWGILIVGFAFIGLALRRAKFRPHVSFRLSVSLAH